MDQSSDFDPGAESGEASSKPDATDPVWHVSTFDPKTLQPLPAPQALKGLSQAITCHLRELEAEIDDSGPACNVLELVQMNFTQLSEYIAVQPKLLNRSERLRIEKLFNDEHECLTELGHLRSDLAPQVKDLQSKMLLCKALFRETEAEWSVV